MQLTILTLSLTLGATLDMGVTLIEKMSAIFHQYLGMENRVDWMITTQSNKTNLNPTC